MHSNALCATPCGLPEETASLPALQRVPERCGADRWWRLGAFVPLQPAILRSLALGGAATAERAAATFLWRRGALRSALHVVRLRIRP